MAALTEKVDQAFMVIQESHQKLKTELEEYKDDEQARNQCNAWIEQSIGALKGVAGDGEQKNPQDEIRQMNTFLEDETLKEAHTRMTGILKEYEEEWNNGLQFYSNCVVEAENSVAYLDGS